MASFPLEVGPAPVDLSTAVSAAAGAVTAWAATGRFRLCNADDNATVYVALQAAAPDGTVPGIPVRLGEWYPHELDFRPAADAGVRVWAWAGRAGTKVMALWT